MSHILEHTVLCGSAKYPCRDPFFKMLNRSLATFMNAFTCECLIEFMYIVVLIVQTHMQYYSTFAAVTAIFLKLPV